MLNVHEPIKATGIRRTYPNMMTREGARGMEWNGWSEGNSPEHTVTLPYTRLLAGPLDYTPGIFKLKFDPQEQFRVHTTLAKQLAMFVVLYSPMQMAADMIENYMDYTPGTCQNMFTQQQAAQMRANLTVFRATIFSTYIPAPPAPPIIYPFGVFSSTLTNDVFVSLGELPEDDAS